METKSIRWSQIFDHLIPIPILIFLAGEEMGILYLENGLLIVKAVRTPTLKTKMTSEKERENGFWSVFGERREPIRFSPSSI